MSDILLNGVDSEDIEEIISKVEASFGFKFVDSELADVKTFGELCDIILSKLPQEEAQDCTSQQAFYRLREAVAKNLQLEKAEISPDTSLKSLLPRQHRKERIREIESSLGFPLKILRPRHFVTWALVVICVSSLVCMFFNWKIGVSGFLFSTLGFRVAIYFGKEFVLSTLGDVAEKMSRENYMKSRRNSTTINRKEVERKVKELFAKDLDLPNGSLTRNATFE